MKNKKTMFKIIISSICVIAFVLGICFLDTIFHKSCLIEFVDNNTEILSQEYVVGQKVTCPELPNKQGYNFVGWVSDKTDTPVKTIVVDGDKVLYAVWETTALKTSFALPTDGSYNIIYNNQVLTSLTNIVAIEKYSNISFDVKLNSGYEFSNPTVFLKTEKRFEELPTIRKQNTLTCALNHITENTEVVVKDVNINSYVVNFSLDGGVFESGVSTIPKLSYNSVVLSDDEELKIVDSFASNFYDIKNPIKEGHKFLGWESVDKQTSTVQELANGNSLTLRAKWEKCKYLVTFDLNGGNCATTRNSTTTELFYGDKINFPEPQKEGFVFMGWFVKLYEINKSIDLEKSVLYDSDTVPAYDIVLYAGWAKRS